MFDKLLKFLCTELVSARQALQQREGWAFSIEAVTTSINILFVYAYYISLNCYMLCYMPLYYDYYHYSHCQKGEILGVVCLASEQRVIGWRFTEPSD